MKKVHTPVLLNQSLDGLNIQSDGFYIDGTLGDAGHSYEILKKLSPKGLLLSIDQDKDAIEFVKKSFKKDERWKIVHGNFAKIDILAGKYQRKPDGILLDIGMSSRQIEESRRGFSYRAANEELDMRMDETLSVTAKDLLKVLTADELTLLFRKYGEERFAKKIANTIKESDEINTVGDLTGLIQGVVPAAQAHQKDPSRRVFQALRIAVNDELFNLKLSLEKSFEILNNTGRLCVISFHSLEDRIVKKFFKEKEVAEKAKIITKKPIVATEVEIKENPRARSAKFRVLEKN